MQRYNREFRGHLQIIPHIEVQAGQSEFALSDHIKRQVDTGAVALYVWGVSADRLVQAGAIDRIRKAVEMAKAHGLPVGVGGHSLLVPMVCEKNQVPCDFYVKTLHSDDYPSATPKPLRKEFIWLDGGEGWYDNMWCINPEETITFMKTVTKPWLAFKVLAAGAASIARASSLASALGRFGGSIYATRPSKLSSLGPSCSPKPKNPPASVRMRAAAFARRARPSRRSTPRPRAGRRLRTVAR